MSIREKHIEEFLSEALNISKEDADVYLNTLEAYLKNQVASGEKVVWTGFLSLEPVDVMERVHRNPKTGEKIIKPEHKKVRVKVSPSFNKMLNQ